MPLTKSKRFLGRVLYGVANGNDAWDALLELQDANGVVLWRNDDTVFLDPAIDYVLTLPGTYYVRVSRTSDTDTGTSPYLLSYDASSYAPAQAVTGGNTTAGSVQLDWNLLRRVLTWGVVPAVSLFAAQ